MDDTTPAPAADSATAPLHAALGEVRMWRHRHADINPRQLAELDAILDRAAVARIERSLGPTEATSLPEAVTAHQAVMRLRRSVLADAARAWDLVEAAAIRQIARFMPGAGSPGEHTPRQR
ncbi:hypothetical protein ABZ330_21650 [Streptomyces sp. NPDC006172]|uniref:hypothetical protein n=1 Tax=Streptomyces sp. NPDC006172 TaxID=3154470 RepID=UPI0033E9EA26